MTKKPETALIVHAEIHELLLDLIIERKREAAAKAENKRLTEEAHKLLAPYKEEFPGVGLEFVDAKGFASARVKFVPGESARISAERLLEQGVHPDKINNATIGVLLRSDSVLIGTNRVNATQISVDASSRYYHE